jgi:hypothetical protein
MSPSRSSARQPIACFYVAAEPGALLSLSLQSDGTAPSFHVLVRHVVTGHVVGRGLATLSQLQLDLQLRRPAVLSYLGAYWTRTDDIVSRGTLPAELHYEILVFPTTPLTTDPIPDVGAWDSPNTGVTMTVNSLGVRRFDPRNVALKPWDPVSTPDVNPWPIP